VSHLQGFNFLEALYVGRFVSKKEIEEFQESLAEHQLKKTKEGWTLLEKASIEHNLIAAAKVYNNIKLEDLGLVLGVTEQKVS
jgi:COP9 signalosome complex subunit 4